MANLFSPQVKLEEGGTVKFPDGYWAAVTFTEQREAVSHVTQSSSEAAILVVRNGKTPLFFHFQGIRTQT